MDQHWKLVVAGGALALVGMATGALLFGTSAAGAQRRYSECFVARQESIDTNARGEIEPLDASHTFHIPSGWEPIAGGGERPGLGALVLCR